MPGVFKCYLTPAAWTANSAADRRRMLDQQDVLFQSVGQTQQQAGERPIDLNIEEVKQQRVREAASKLDADTVEELRPQKELLQTQEQARRVAIKKAESARKVEAAAASDEAKLALEHRRRDNTLQYWFLPLAHWQDIGFEHSLDGPSGFGLQHHHLLPALTSVAPSPRSPALQDQVRSPPAPLLRDSAR